MTDRINLTQLREKATTGDNLHQRDVVLALITATDAALEVADMPSAIVNSGAHERLREALAPFTTEDG